VPRLIFHVQKFTALHRPRCCNWLDIITADWRTDDKLAKKTHCPRAARNHTKQSRPKSLSAVCYW